MGNSLSAEPASISATPIIRGRPSPRAGSIHHPLHMKKPLTTMLFALAMAAPLLAAAQAQAGKAGDAKAGGGKAAMCIGCHGIEGYQSSFPEVYKVPMIA